jgi:hypothetical protein
MPAQTLQYLRIPDLTQLQHPAPERFRPHRNPDPGAPVTWAKAIPWGSGGCSERVLRSAGLRHCQEVDKNRAPFLNQVPDIPHHLLDPHRSEGVSFGVFRAKGTLAPVASARRAVWQNETGSKIVLRRKLSVIRRDMVIVAAHTGKRKESILSGA